MRSRIPWIFALVFACTTLTARADPPPASPPPAAGDALRIDADDAHAGLRIALMRASVRVGDPDSDRFEERCEVTAPMTATVLGSFDDVIVVRYASSAVRPGDSLACRDGGAVLLDRAAWTALRGVESRLAEERAARERRRATVRAIIGAPARAVAPARR